MSMSLEYYRGMLHKASTMLPPASGKIISTTQENDRATKLLYERTSQEAEIHLSLDVY